MHKSGAPHLSVDQIIQCTEIAAVKVSEINIWLQSELIADDGRRLRMASSSSKKRTFDEDLMELEALESLAMSPPIKEGVVPEASVKEVPVEFAQLDDTEDPAGV